MDVAMYNATITKINIIMTVDNSCLVIEPLSQPGLEPEKQFIYIYIYTCRLYVSIVQHKQSIPANAMLSASFGPSRTTHQAIR